MNRLTAILFFGVLASGMTQAATSGGYDGIVHFYGNIVESPCQFNSTENGMTSHCSRDGKNMVQTHTVNAVSLPNFTLPRDIGVVSTQHVNNNPNLAIMTVSYH